MHLRFGGKPLASGEGPWLASDTHTLSWALVYTEHGTTSILTNDLIRPKDKEFWSIKRKLLLLKGVAEQGREGVGGKEMRKITTILG